MTASFIRESLGDGGNCAEQYEAIAKRNRFMFFLLSQGTKVLDLPDNLSYRAIAKANTKMKGRVSRWLRF
jgi:hypothetical protein